MIRAHDRPNGDGLFFFRIDGVSTDSDFGGIIGVPTFPFF